MWFLVGLNRIRNRPSLSTPRGAISQKQLFLGKLDAAQSTASVQALTGALLAEFLGKRWHDDQRN